VSNRKPFRFGVVNETPLPANQWFGHVRWIEELGYSTFLIRDHLTPDFFGEQFAPLIALMAAAGVTSRLRLGTLVIDNDFRHPAMLAKEAATLDLLSGGRFELGLGAGWMRREYAAAGLPYDRDQLENFPSPAQRPHPPLLIGGGKRRVLSLAGREADIVSILTVSVASGSSEDDPRERLAPAVRQKLDWIREGAGERYDQIELSVFPTLLPTDNPVRRAAELIAERGWTGVTVDDVLAMPSLLFGSEDEMVDTLIRRRDEYGFSYFIVSDTIAGDLAPIVARLAGR
jgi:alkanesulfonate monooxygenase SsuD/methylene tetrahydromethanopterin reductase-like flavin-dependent oxidoreductase (luciferase family)